MTMTTTTERRDRWWGPARPTRRALLLAVPALLAGAPAASAQAPADGRPRQAVVTVKGMQCPFCAYGIRKHLRKLPGVDSVTIELAENQAIVTFDPGAGATDEEIQRAVRKARFTAGTIEWRPAETPPRTDRLRDGDR